MDKCMICTSTEPCEYRRFDVKMYMNMVGKDVIEATMNKEAGYVFTIERDTDILHPRRGEHAMNTLGKLVCWHSRYVLSDSNELIMKWPTPQDFRAWFHEANEPDKENPTYHFWPVYMYEHGDVILSLNDFHDQFDSGQVGFYLINWKDFKSNFTGAHGQNTQVMLAHAKDIIENELKVYTSYLNGEVYCLGFHDLCIGETDYCGGYYWHTEHEKKNCCIKFLKDKLDSGNLEEIYNNLEDIETFKRTVNMF